LAEGKTRGRRKKGRKMDIARQRNRLGNEQKDVLLCLKKDDRKGEFGKESA